MAVSFAIKKILLASFFLKSTVLSRNVVLAITGSSLIAISAQITVPMWPVPFTMQTFAVLMVGMIYGCHLGFLTLLAYLMEGACGLPVFSGFSSGIHNLVGPTGGYLLGFLLSATFVGWLSDKGWNENILKISLAVILGNVAIFLPGVLWLGSIIGFDKALQFGLYPFWVGFLIKSSLAVISLMVFYSLGKKSSKAI